MSVHIGTQPAHAVPDDGHGRAVKCTVQRDKLVERLKKHVGPPLAPLALNRLRTLRHERAEGARERRRWRARRGGHLIGNKFR